ncbi:MAG: GIY-YIG nuclease family protein [Bacilli bacterium]|nr:GIY-YIG nuclease family protein [Bacilli bacterium]
MNDTVGYIYILKNPSFPDYIKIGYADDVYSRLKQLNDKSAVPFAFRLYAYYKVNHRLEDKTVHDIIDKLNPSLRAKDNIDGKERKREFFEMSAEDAYDLLHCIAKINGLEDNLVLVEPTAKEMEDEDEATTKRKSTQLPKMDWLIEQGIINIGDEVYLINHPEEIATIEDSRNIRYKDQIMSFNQFGCELTGWKAIQIYAFMKKVGGDKTLSKLREEKMKELGMLD